MEFVKLTGKTGEAVHINPEHVSVVIKDDKRTVVHVVGFNTGIVVTESVNQVLNMLEGRDRVVKGTVESKPKTTNNKTNSKKTNGTKKDMQ